MTMYRLLSSEHRAAGHSKIVLDKTDFKLKNTIVFSFNQFQTFSHFLEYTFNYNKVDHALLDGFDKTSLYLDSRDSWCFFFLFSPVPLVWGYWDLTLMD